MAQSTRHSLEMCERVFWFASDCQFEVSRFSRQFVDTINPALDYTSEVEGQAQEYREALERPDNGYLLPHLAPHGIDAAYHDHLDMLSSWALQTSSLFVRYLIVGVYHLYEIRARDLVRLLKGTVPKYMSPKRFLKELRTEGNFASSLSEKIARLDKYRLIANAAKHGEGDSLTELYELDPSLFHRLEDGETATADHLSVGSYELEALAKLIEEMWRDIQMPFEQKIVAARGDSEGSGLGTGL